MFEFGYLEPETIPPGRCSMRQALSFLSEHKTDPNEVGNAESIARRYNLDANRVKDVLSHFMVFNVSTAKSMIEAATSVEKETPQYPVVDMSTDTFKKS